MLRLIALIVLSILFCHSESFTTVGHGRQPFTGATRWNYISRSSHCNLRPTVSQSKQHGLSTFIRSASSSMLQAKTSSETIDEVDEVAIAKHKADMQATQAWVAAALAFAAGIATFKGSGPAVEFLSGYFLELTLSVDNLIVFLILFDFFKVEKEAEERILTWGLLGAIVLRALFIGVGTVALANFKQVLGLFAVVLAYSSFKILFSGDDEDEDPADSAVVKFAKKYLRTTDKRDGTNFFTTIDGVKYATPLFLCLVCVELSDILFAFDSVPAIFGVTQDPLIVFSSNIFAIAGLRSLYGVLSKAIDDLKYLDKAVAVVLAVIAAKLGAETVGIELLNPLQSLGVVIGVLGTGIVASLVDKGDDE